jgi:chromosome segregation ATPase
MALPMQLRIKATSERLRTNHIDLLEYTEKLSQENETLKNRMEQVMRNASLSTSSLPFEDHEPVEDAEKRRLLNEIENLKMEVETLSKKLMSSEIDKKTLKAKAQLSQPNNDERLSNLRSRLEEETRLKLECSEHILALQEETCKLRQENDFLRQEMSEVVEEVSISWEIHLFL